MVNISTAYGEMNVKMIKGGKDVTTPELKFEFAKLHNTYLTMNFYGTELSYIPPVIGQEDGPISVTGQGRSSYKNTLEASYQFKDSKALENIMRDLNIDHIFIEITYDEYEEEDKWVSRNDILELSAKIEDDKYRLTKYEHREGEVFDGFTAYKMMYKKHEAFKFLTFEDIEDMTREVYDIDIVTDESGTKIEKIDLEPSSGNSIGIEDISLDIEESTDEEGHYIISGYKKDFNNGEKHPLIKMNKVEIQSTNLDGDIEVHHDYINVQDYGLIEFIRKYTDDEIGFPVHIDSFYFNGKEVTDYSALREYYKNKLK